MIDPVIQTRDGKPVAFHDLTRDTFPFRVRFFDMETEELLGEIIVRGTGGIDVPGFAPRQVKVEVTYANGLQFIEGPGMESEARQITPPPRF